MKLLEFVFLLTLIFQLVTSKPSPNEFISPEKDSTDYDVQEIKRNIEPPEKIVNINLKNEGGLKITYPNGEIIVPSERKNVHIKTIDVFEEKDRNPSSEKFNRNEKDENKENGKGSQDHFSENTFFPIFYNYYFNQDPKSNKPNIQQAANYLPYVLQHQPQNSEDTLNQEETGQGHFSENAFFPTYYNYYYNQGDTFKENTYTQNVQQPRDFPNDPPFQSQNQEGGQISGIPQNVWIQILKSNQEVSSRYGYNISLPNLFHNVKPINGGVLPPHNLDPRNHDTRISYSNSIDEVTTERPTLISSIKQIFDIRNFGLKKITKYDLVLELFSDFILIFTYFITFNLKSIPPKIHGAFVAILSYFFGREVEDVNIT